MSDCSPRPFPKIKLDPWEPENLWKAKPDAVLLSLPWSDPNSDPIGDILRMREEWKHRPKT